MKIRFEKGQFGWHVYKRRGNAFVYVGHFRTKREAREHLIGLDSMKG